MTKRQAARLRGLIGAVCDATKELYALHGKQFQEIYHATEELTLRREALFSYIREITR